MLQTLHTARRAAALRLLVATAAGLAIIVGLFLSREHLSLEALARREQSFRGFHEAHPVQTYAAAAGLYVVVTGLSIPVATALSLVCGWLLGFWPALVVVSFGAAAGATVAMLMSRYLFHEAVRRRFGERLSSLDASLRREGVVYLFVLRLTPLVPFWLVNLGMGLTRLRVRTFWWVTQLGMLPASALWVWAGASVPSLTNLADDVEREGVWAVVDWQVLAALSLAALLPLLARPLLRRNGAPRADERSRRNGGEIGP